MILDTVITEKTVLAELKEKSEISPGVRSYLFEPDDDFPYTAGQYVFCSFNFNGKKYQKHFTVSNSPTRPGLEISTVVTRTNFKTALDSLEPGQEIKIRGGHGDFTLESMRQEKVCFIQEGIGITPVRSMMQYVMDSGSDLDAKLFYASPGPGGILFREEIEGAESYIPGFRVIHTLTGSTDNTYENWRGRRGPVNADMIRENCPDYEDRHFYISGSAAFNRAVKKMLTLDLDMEDYFVSVENFTGY